MKLAFVCCSESGALDRDSNRISLFNVLPSISVPANRFPARLLKLMIGFCFSRETNEQTPQAVRIDVTSGDTTCGVDMPVAFGIHNIFQGLLRVDDLLIPTPGKIHIQIGHGGTVYGEFDCHVFATAPVPSDVPPPAAAQPVPSAESEPEPAKRTRAKSPNKKTK